MSQGWGMAERDIMYLKRRADEEAQRALDTSDTDTAAIHRRMAQLYEDRVAALIDNPDFDPILQVRPKR
ncbi:MAG: hypothetical protein LH485_02930 [Sphingomonas bacterium]|nr:hypothetical protein [Sphingomonas bacterium]